MKTAVEKRVLPFRSDAARRAVVLIALSLVFPAIAAPPTFLGSELPPWPSDCSVAEGAVLGDPDQPNHLAYEHLKCGTRELVLLLRFVERREGKAYFIVVDEIEPTLASHQQLMGISMCSPANEAEGNVIAIGTLSRVTDRELRAYDLAFAWRFDLSAAKIRPTATVGVSCGWRNVD